MPESGVRPLALELSPFRPEDLEAMRGMIADPSLAYEFDILNARGHLEQMLDDSFHAQDASRIVRVAGEPAGFCLVLRIPAAGGGAWAALRLGVLERFHRRGVGGRLLEEVRSHLERNVVPGGLHEIVLSAWRPNEAAAAFAARHGHRHVRSFWRMRRPIAPVPEPRWPAGVTLRTFDGGDRALEDWIEVYNASFAQHYHFVPSTVALGREIAARPLFLADGLALAYREGRCAGFCGNEQLGSTGVVAVLGVIPEARGIGLGRALLRWAVGYFAAKGFAEVSLVVDGENDSALALYRSEEFTVERTRDMWSRVPAGAGSPPHA